jgi:tripartite ATP-independent transporter DctM subunit
MAGILPGVVTLIAIGVYAVYVGVSNKMPRTPFVGKEAFQALRDTKWEVLLPVALLGGLMTGALRIHEAAAFTALYVLIIEVWVYKDVSFRKDLPRIIRDSMTLVGAILIILSTAVGFTAFLIQARVPFLILDAMESIIQSKFAFLLVLNVFLLIVGMLMDIFSAIVVVVPLIVPIATRFGVDPVHLGITFLLNLEIGYMTPPVGLNLFISSFRFAKPVTLLYRAVLPFIGLLLIALLFTTYIEKLSMWLPERMGYVPSASLHAMEDPTGGSQPEAAEDSGGGNLDDLGEDDSLDLDDLEGEDDSLDLDDLEGEVGVDDSTAEDALDDLAGEGADALDGEGSEDPSVSPSAP